MTRSSVEAIVRSLNAAGVRYLIAGGLAVVAHGYMRFTADVDIVLAFDEDNLNEAIRALSGLGYRPRAPVDFTEFADSEKRHAWIHDRGLAVFSIFSPVHAATEIDIFVEPPFDFDRAYRKCTRLEVAPGVEACFVGLDDLIEMKRSVGRPQDMDDIRHLEQRRGGSPS